MKWLQKIDGNKTYILTIAGGIFALIHFAVIGDWSMTALIQLSQNEAFIGTLAALRHGIAKAGNQGVVTTGTNLAQSSAQQSPTPGA